MIGLVLVTYAHWPEKLIASVEASGLDVVWYVHHHGSEPEFAARVAKLADRSNFRVTMHLTNRGLSRSWNDGLHQAYQDGAEFVLLLNDDLHFVGEGLRAFIDFARAREGYGLAFLHGLETGGSHYAGKIMAQDFACCVVTKLALDTVGWFDENIRPAYYEDFDYFRRCHLSGVQIITAGGVLVEHERSKTTRDNPEVAANNDRVMARNAAYYTAKWGAPGKETHRTPFGDNMFGNKIEWAVRANPYPGHAPEGSAP